MDMELNPWVIKFLKANKDLMFEALHEAAKQTETNFDDMAVDLLEGPVKEWIEGLEVEDEELI